MWQQRRVKVRRNSLVRPPRSSGSSSDPVAFENPCSPPNLPASPRRRGRHSTAPVPLSRQHLLLHQTATDNLDYYHYNNNTSNKPMWVCVYVRYEIYAPLSADDRRRYSACAQSVMEEQGEAIKRNVGKRRCHYNIHHTKEKKRFI